MNTKFVLVAIPWALTLGAAYWLGSSLSSEPPFEQGDATAGNLGKPVIEGESTWREADEAESGNAFGSGTPLDAFELLAEDPSSFNWEEAEEAIALMRPWEAEEALGALMELPAGQRRDRMLRELLELWAQQSPDEALAYLANVESMRLRDRAMDDILEVWGAKDPAAAMQWLTDNSAEMTARALNDHVLSIIEGYAESDPSGAFNYSANLPNNTGSERRLKRQALRESARALVAQDRIPEAVSLTAELEDPELQQDIFAEIIGEWAEFDPATASQHLEILGPEAKAEAHRELIRSWAEFDPVAAAGWLASLPAETEGTGQLVTELIGRWTRYDLEASAEWLNQMPPSPEIDRAVAIYTYRSAQEDPATAMSWAESITSGGMRNRMMQRVASEWKQQDEKGFQNYLDAAELTNEQRSQLSNAQPRGGGRGFWRREDD